MSSLLLLLLGGNPAQPPAAPPDTKAEAEEASALAKKLAATFAVELQQPADKKAKLKMEPEPVLRWTNHLGRRFYGDVYVWTHEGRPEVVASVTSIFTAKKDTYTEIQSISEGRPVLSRGEKIVWQPAERGVEFKPLAGAPKVGATAAERLRQMKTLAAQFSVVADYGVAKEEKEELRLLGTPIYRYQSAEQGVTDGGLFAFTKGIDPDALLLIEARGKKDPPEWHFALARFNGHCVLRAVREEKEVWKVERLANKAVSDPKSPYFNFR